MGCGSSKPSNSAVVQAQIDSGEYDAKDYEDLIYLANKREIKVTIQTSTKAGLAAGLSVMAGTLVAGPVGAAVGGAVGTAMAVGMSRNVVGLNKLLQDTPPKKRGQIIQCFTESFKEEFMDTINGSPELKLLLRGGSPIGVVRYMVEKDIIQNDQAKRLDGILAKVT
ncbi:unnamed protein product [Cylindrotheca closterium]|uniref:Uncharacterized protein n=1 Tax=Cylindrotheca closterium TaxID=2856 RepID=A0AAD2JHN0_9STRA|nr:unnamed protein product [Cylindrotheca closterium]